MSTRTTLVLLAVLTALVLLVVFVPTLSVPRITLNHIRAVHSLRNINQAERSYAVRHPEIGFICDLSELNKQITDPASGAPIVGAAVASGTSGGYHFESRCPEVKGKPARSYTVTAVPTVPGTTGKWALCTDQRGQIWYSESGSASDCLAARRPAPEEYR